MNNVLNHLIRVCLIFGIVLIHGCKKDPGKPILTTTAVSGVAVNTATSGGTITSDGGAPVTVSGICWKTTPNPVITDSHTTDSTGTKSFTGSITGLTPNTLYYVRAYSTNSVGTGYGNEVSFTTRPILVAILTTTAITSIAPTTAVSGGNITSDGGGAVTERGVCWNTITGPTTANSVTTDGAGNGIYVSDLTNLLPATIYYVRAYATNSTGVSYGNELTFTTPNSIPVITTTAVSAITLNAATSGGNIISNGGELITVSGICWSTTTNPVITNSKTTNELPTGTFTGNMTGLLPGTNYFVRAYATNSLGTAYGNLVSFNTKITDVEGNTYNTVTIGTQVWMAENLKTTRFNDNSVIPNVTDNTGWINLITPGYCWYDNNGTLNKDLYGALYNWHSVNTGKLCPSGWHAPTDAEYNTLELYLGMPQAGVDFWGWRGTDQGARMKNNTGWAVGENGTNTTGFSALPGGYRFYEIGKFNGRGILGYFWSTTQDDASRAWYRRLDGNASNIYRASTEKYAGKSFRCLKN